MEKGIVTTDVCIINIMFNEILKLNKNFNSSLITIIHYLIALILVLMVIQL